MEANKVNLPPHLAKYFATPKARERSERIMAPVLNKKPVKGEDYTVTEITSDEIFGF